MSAIGFVVRLLYFLVVPFVLVFTAAAIPMTGVLINFILLLAGFIGIERLRKSADRHRIVGVFVRRQLRFEAFYREHPPRLFLYYVLYPLLFPFMLASRVARQEFALYRGFTALGVVLLIAFGVVDYFINWAPEIALGEFAANWFAVLFLQILVLIAFMIPLSVTIVGYQLAGSARSVKIMLGAAAMSLALAALGAANMKEPLTPAPTLARARLRGEADPGRAVAVQTAALRGIWLDLRDRRAALDSEGWLEGPALAHAHAELADFYRRDEAAAFLVRVWPVDAPAGVLLKCKQPGDRPPLWLAMTADGAVLPYPTALPAGLLESYPDHRSDRHKQPADR